MSLMLNSLKRIEARRASVRTEAPASVAPVPAEGQVAAADSLREYVAAEQPRVDSSVPSDLILDSCHEDFAGNEIAACADDIAVAAAVATETIDLPPEFSVVGGLDLTPEEVALAGNVSLESAVDELADLLAEARYFDQSAPVDQPPPAEESADYSSLREVLDRACGAGFNQPAEMPSAVVHIVGGPEYETGYPLGAVEVFAAAAPTPELVRASLESINAALSQSPAGSAGADQPATAEVVPEPMVVQPLGSDPYAAAAWQILRQLPQRSPQVLLFTSPGDAHGKTTTLARLLPHVARAFSGSVLVVDANTRNPDLARRLEVGTTWRLTDVLAGATHWMNAVRPTALPRISLLPGGADPAGRLGAADAGGERVARLLRELAGHYDLVLVDATSLAHDGAAQLAAACDATCLVVRLGIADRRIVRDAVRVLNRAGGRLLGCIAVDAGGMRSRFLSHSQTAAIIQARIISGRFQGGHSEGMSNDHSRSAARGCFRFP